MSSPSAAFEREVNSVYTNVNVRYRRQKREQCIVSHGNQFARCHCPLVRYLDNSMLHDDFTEDFDLTEILSEKART